MNRSGPVFLVLFSLLLSTGCVTKGKYEALQADSAQTKASMTSTIETQAAEIARLEADVMAATQSVNRLESRLAELIKDKSQLDASVLEMEAALSQAQQRKVAADARIAQYRQLLDRFKDMIDAGTLRVQIQDGRMVVALATDILFASGSAKLSDEGKASISQVAQVLTSISERNFQIEGHTDNVPISTATFPSNWYLAFGRAMTVLDTMVAAGMPATSLSAASLGDLRPVATNETDEGRSANRRIEIVVIPDLSSLPGFDELNSIAKPVEE